MKKFIQNMYQKTNFVPRLIAVIVAVIIMGFSLSWLVLVDMGTDPCTSLNLAVSSRLHMSLGNWQALFNSFLFIFVIIFGKEHIGFGTIANMFLVGYSLDFFSWIWSQILPEGLFDSMVVRIIVLILALTVFVFSAAVYMDMKLGTSPYDAISFIIASRQKAVPFKLVRIIYDVVVIIAAWLLGSKIGAVTILMGFTLGPVIGYVGGLLSGFVPDDN